MNLERIIENASLVIVIAFVAVVISVVASCVLMPPTNGISLQQESASWGDALRQWLGD